MPTESPQRLSGQEAVAEGRALAAQGRENRTGCHKKAQQKRICLEVRLHISTVTLAWRRRKTACSVATSHLREMHLLGVRKRVNVLEWGLPLALQTMGVVDVLGEEGVKVTAIVGKLAVNDGLGAIKASLLRSRWRRPGLSGRCQAPR